MREVWAWVMCGRGECGYKRVQCREGVIVRGVGGDGVSVVGVGDSNVGNIGNVGMGSMGLGDGKA